ncbi:MAG: alkaline phosphatase [Bacteroidaceae bacterium]|nr:alkaline phosphatase [Bacteroidaceae bacterium]
MKKVTTLLLLICIASIGLAKNPKYVFYFIGDGMGPSHILGTELYLGELSGVIGRPHKLHLTQLPHSAFVTTFSKTNGVTDSAASGTALATGEKTYNGAIGITSEGTPLYSVAHAAKQAGYAVGVSTTVCINHATPGAFYAHQKSRNNYPQIAEEMLTAGYDFYAGGDPVCNDEQRSNLYKKAKEQGYTIARGYDDYKAGSNSATKMMLFQEEVATEIPYTIDRDDNDLTLAQITEAGIDFLKEKSKKGFFFMVEGGKIDYASHSNDAATMMQEVLDFDRAIAVALDFYKKHSKETLIIITADHETGGLVLGYNSNYTLNLKALAGQKVSADKMKEIIKEEADKKALGWDEAKELLKENFGLWEESEVRTEAENNLKQLFTDAMNSSGDKRNDLLNTFVNLARTVVARSAALSWASGNHSGTFVPLFAIGAGAENFKGIIDNTDIPKMIKKIAKY